MDKKLETDGWRRASLNDQTYSFEQRLFRLHPGPLLPVKCGRGWLPILSELDQRLAEIDPEYELFQIEQKFGALVVHARPSLVSDCVERWFDELILDARGQASTTCEECGERGERRTVLGWMAVLCDGDLAKYHGGADA